MISTTLVAIKAILDMDTTISIEHREGIIKFAANDEYTTDNILKNQSDDDVVSIEKAAELLGKSKQTIQRYLKDGSLHPIIPPHKTRAIGVSLKSIRKLSTIGEATNRTLTAGV